MTLILVQWYNHESGVEERAVWENQSILELLERNFRITTSQSGKFKLFQSPTNIPLLSIFCWANFFKNPNQVLRIFNFLRSKSEIISSPFCVTEHPFSLTPHHWKCDISTFFVSFNVLWTSAYHFCIFHFFWVYFLPIYGDAHHSTISLQLHDILKAFITTTP